MKLKWENYTKIAEALDKKYQNIDILNTYDDDIIKMVNSLEEFDDVSKPEDNRLVEAVFNVLIKLKIGSKDFEKKDHGYV